MYASSEPCPMCLVACYWARIPRLVFGASSLRSPLTFEDLQFYRELALPSGQRSLREESADGSVKQDAVSVLKEWAIDLLQPVVPKY
jgi:guanine deaminase